ncbi:MAG: DJ-1/PfpI family protein [Dermatophilaceae bacterium]
MTPRTVHLALVDTMADWEVGYLAAHLTHLGGESPQGDLRLRTVGQADRPVITKGGLRVIPDLTLDELDPRDSAMLVLPGGDEWHLPERTGPFVTAASAFLAAGTPVAAVCGATFALAAAGLLDDVAHTSNDPSFLAASGYAGGGRYVGEPAVVDGDVVTATGIAPVHFAAAVFRRLGAHPEHRLDAWVRLYGDRDPAGYFALMSA